MHICEIVQASWSYAKSALHRWSMYVIFCITSNNINDAVRCFQTVKKGKLLSVLHLFDLLCFPLFNEAWLIESSFNEIALISQNPHYHIEALVLSAEKCSGFIGFECALLFKWRRHYISWADFYKSCSNAWYENEVSIELKFRPIICFWEEKKHNQGWKELQNNVSNYK